MFYRYINYSNIKKFIYEYLIKSIFDKRSKNIFKQFLELLWITLKTRYLPHNYYKYNGHLKGVDIKEICNYIPGRVFDSLRNDLLNDKSLSLLLDNKYLFNRILSSNNVPCTEIYGIFNKESGFFDSGFNTATFESILKTINCDFVIKPVNGSAQGDGVKVFSFIDETRLTVDNMQININDLNLFLSKIVKNEMLIEKKINQIETLSEIYPFSINTIRIDSLRTLNGEVLIGGALLRVGRNGRRVDNWSGKSGGIGIPIDLDTYSLGKYGYDYFVNKYFEHPDTKIVFNKVKLPFMKDILALIKDAALLFPKINCIGWDIAMTSDGPVIIEANHDYSLQLSQVCIGPYLEKHDFISALRDYIEKSGYGVKYEKYFNCQHQC